VRGQGQAVAGPAGPVVLEPPGLVLVAEVPRDWALPEWEPPASEHPEWAFVRELALHYEAQQALVRFKMLERLMHFSVQNLLQKALSRVSEQLS